MKTKAIMPVHWAGRAIVGKGFLKLQKNILKAFIHDFANLPGVIFW